MSDVIWQSEFTIKSRLIDINKILPLIQYVIKNSPFPSGEFTELSIDPGKSIRPRLWRFVFAGSLEWSDWCKDYDCEDNPETIISRDMAEFAEILRSRMGEVNLYSNGYKFDAAVLTQIDTTVKILEAADIG